MKTSALLFIITVIVGILTLWVIKQPMPGTPNGTCLRVVVAGLYLLAAGVVFWFARKTPSPKPYKRMNRGQAAISFALFITLFAFIGMLEWWESRHIRH